MEALNAVPFAGLVVKGGVAGTIIKGLGEAIIAHYEKLEQQEKSIPETDNATVIDIPRPTHRSFRPRPEYPPMTGCKRFKTCWTKNSSPRLNTIPNGSKF